MSRSDYHWIVTLQWTDPAGNTITQTGMGRITPGSAATRENLVADVLKYARKNQGAPKNAAVLFLSLEPNELPKPRKTKKA